MGRAVRPGRRAALPRRHRLPALLRRGPQPRQRAVHLARGTGGVGRHRAGRRRRGSSAPGCVASGCSPVLDAVAPGVLVPRPSGAGATGSTRSSTAGRPTCRGAWRSTPPTGRAATSASTCTFHPTFLYESLWALARLRCGHLARPAVQARPRPGGGALRDGLHRWAAGGSRRCASTTSQLDDVAGLRLNTWTSLVLFVAGGGVLRDLGPAAARDARPRSTRHAAGPRAPPTSRPA